jgi:hypothetical protein
MLSATEHTMQMTKDDRSNALSRRLAALSPAKRALLEQSFISKRARSTDAIAPTGGRTSAPLSFAQTRLWFLARLNRNSTAYHMPEAMRLRGDLNREALAQAVREVGARHATLRTRFAEVDGEPVQRVDPDSTIELKFADLGNLKERAQENAITAALRHETELPFDLAQGQERARSAVELPSHCLRRLVGGRVPTGIGCAVWSLLRRPA